MEKSELYTAISWEAMRMFEKEGIPSIFVSVLTNKTEKEQRKAFTRGQHNRPRIILSWLFAQLVKRQIIQNQSIFDFAKQLQTFVPQLTEERWDAIKWEGDFSLKKNKEFDYPTFPFKLDNFGVTTKLVSQIINEKRWQIAESKCEKFPTVHLDADYTGHDDVDDLYHRKGA